MAWSVMSVFDTGRLQIVKGNMNQDKYNKTILEKRQLPHLNEWASRRCFYGPYSCTIVLHVIKEDQLPSFLLSMKLKYFHGRGAS